MSPAFLSTDQAGRAGLRKAVSVRVIWRRNSNQRSSRELTIVTLRFIVVTYDGIGQLSQNDWTPSKSILGCLFQGIVFEDFFQWHFQRLGPPKSEIKISRCWTPFPSPQQRNFSSRRLPGAVFGLNLCIASMLSILAGVVEEEGEGGR